MGIPLTDQQRAVVEDRGGELLVSAAAGSGKTRVLVERLLDRVEQEEIDIDRFLVITYTKAAAAELRARIVAELGTRLAAAPGNRRLRRQATLVYKTQISTIHAFCAQFLRECAHRLDLTPDFRLCDEREASLLQLQVLEDVMEARYERIDPEGDFAQLLDLMAKGRDDRQVVEIVLDIYHRIQSHPHPAAWLAEQLETFALEGVEDPGETPWGRLLLDHAAQQADYWQGRMAWAMDLALGEEQLEERYAPSLRETMDGLRDFAAAAGHGWEAAAAHGEIPFPRLGVVRDCGDPAAQETIKTLRDKCKRRLAKLSELFRDSGAQLLADMRLVYPAVRGLFALVEDFSAAYAARKRDRGLLDFGDLEHLSVELLVGADGAPTDLAGQWADRYAEVMVDEYQDTNEVQNAIFRALSHGGRTLFMVGDVKQSIYRFRLADPTIFLAKYRAFPAHTQARPGQPRRILLSRNFRSRPQVLEGVNYLFRSLMSESFGEMEYGPDQALYPGAEFPGRAEDYALELDALDLSGDREDGPVRPGRDLLEARFVARRIRTMLEEGFPVSDGGELRPVRPGDMVILLRSPGTVLQSYLQALGELDLPWEAEGGEDFLASTEASVALSYLQIIDNPRQDVALISVLRSPIYGFSPDRLAEIRALDRTGDFYDALCLDQREDSRAFLAELADLRDRAGDLSCHQLLWELYDRTNLLGIFSALGDGETRRGNLLALCQCAREFEEAGHRGLFGFLSYLTRLRERGERFSAPHLAGEGRGIRILSIHKSKGLEFPVVFLCGLARRFNREDIQRAMLFHPRLGVGPKGLDRARMIEFSTLARRAVAAQLEREMLAEELRLLYVAMTRAREKLVLVCALTGGARDLQRLGTDVGCPVEPQVLLASPSVEQWILLAALARPDGEPLRRAAELTWPPAEGPWGPAWEVNWVDGADLIPTPPRRYDPAGRAEEAAPADPGLVARLAWTYPHGGVVDVPSKLTATQLKGRDLDQEAGEGAPPPPRPIRFQRPRFAQEELGLTPAQKGTALHLVMQFIDFDRAGTAEGVAEEIARLVEAEILSPQQGRAVDPEKPAALFRSPLGREMIGSGTLRREFKFSILAPAADYYPGVGPEERVLLQGVVDCWFETAEGITVVDFKTDRVTGETVAARAAEYRPQLEAYTRALEEVTGRPVVRRVLWFFALDRAVEV